MNGPKDAGHDHKIDSSNVTYIYPHTKFKRAKPNVFQVTAFLGQYICGDSVPRMNFKCPQFCPGLVFTNILILRIYLLLEFSKNFVESWEIF